MHACLLCWQSAGRCARRDTRALRLWLVNALGQLSLAWGSGRSASSTEGERALWCEWKDMTMHRWLSLKLWQCAEVRQLLLFCRNAAAPGAGLLDFQLSTIVCRRCAAPQLLSHLPCSLTKQTTTDATRYAPAKQRITVYLCFPRSSLDQELKLRAPAWHITSRQNILSALERACVQAI